MTAETYLESEGINKDALFDYDELVKLLKSFKGYKPKKSIEYRKREFGSSVHRIGILNNTYSFELVSMFIDYWTEHGENDRKMRFEKQTSFNIKLRLARWKRNSNGFDKPKKESAATILQRKHGLID